MKTVLIVDDMAIFREPLAATLRQEGFKTLTASNGQQALRMVREERPDLILLDAAMPVMDGIGFCQHLRGDDEFREIPIIMLTAITDRTVVQKAVQAGVQDYLLKTQFTTQELLNRINRLFQSGAAAQMLVVDAANEGDQDDDAPDRVNADRALACIREHMQMRSIKPVLQHVLALTRSSVSSFDDIAGAIRQDQALAMKVMRVANSSFYRTGKPVTTLREAEQRIGLSGIRNITAAILAIEEFSEANPAGIIPQRFWEHALATAIVGERLGAAVDAPHPEDIFLAGLLHDVGRLVLSDVLASHYGRIIEDSRAQDLDLFGLERERLEITHVEVTREVLTQWRMPPHIVEEAALHHLPLERIRQSARYPRAALCVVLADRLAHALLLGDSGSEAIDTLDELAQAIGLDLRTLQRIAGDAVASATDAAFFYASQSDTRTLDPLALQLRADAAAPPRIVAPQSPAASLRPVLLMLEQLGWLQPDQPNVALIGGDSEAQMYQQLRAVLAQRGEERKLPVLWVTRDASLWNPPSDRAFVRVTLPCRHSHIIAALHTVVQDASTERLSWT